MFVEWYDSWGEPQLSFLPWWKGIVVVLSGYGKWVPRNQIILEGEDE